LRFSIIRAWNLFRISSFDSGSGSAGLGVGDKSMDRLPVAEFARIHVEVVRLNSCEFSYWQVFFPPPPYSAYIGIEARTLPENQHCVDDFILLQWMRGDEFLGVRKPLPARHALGGEATMRDGVSSPRSAIATRFRATCRL
jgi:hypothetical protein